MNPLVPLAILLLVLIAVLFFLSRHAKLQPVQQIETDVAHETVAH